jgi:prepilin-type processing-associated H-X9-DG protein
MPIPFTCPHCGASSVVADQYAGQTGPCAKCGQIITVPLPGGTSAPAATRSSSPVLMVLGILAAVGVCVVGCAALLIVPLGLPAIGAARNAAQRSQSANNLKMIGVALHNYAEVHGTLPPAYLPDDQGRPMHSWRVLILPYVGEDALYRQYNFDEPWDGPGNSSLLGRMPAVYASPNAGADPPGTTHYMVVQGPTTMFNGATAARFADVTDGLSNTIALVEATRGANWMDPTDLDFTLMTFRINDPGGNDIGSHAPQGANVLMGDGSVRFLSDSLDPATVQHLLEKSDGNFVPAF